MASRKPTLDAVHCAVAHTQIKGERPSANKAKRVADLEAEVNPRTTADENFNALLNFFQSTVQAAGHAGMMQLPALLADGNRHDKASICLRMTAMGSEAAAVYRARYQAVTGNYVEEAESIEYPGTGLKLTETGRLKAIVSKTI